MTNQVILGLCGFFVTKKWFLISCSWKPIFCLLDTYQNEKSVKWTSRILPQFPLGISVKIFFYEILNFKILLNIIDFPNLKILNIGNPRFDHIFKNNRALNQKAIFPSEFGRSYPNLDLESYFSIWQKTNRSSNPIIQFERIRITFFKKYPISIRIRT